MKKLDSYLAHAIAPLDRLGSSEAAGASLSEVRVPVLLRVDSAKFNPDAISGFELTSLIGNIAAGTATLVSFERLQADPTVLSVEASRGGAIEELSTSVPFSRGNLVHRPPINEDGSFALVAIIDTGIDVLHHCFRDADGNTRVEAVWDQTETKGPTPSERGYSKGLNFGTSYQGGYLALHRNE
jgi:hypothetical protein